MVTSCRNSACKGKQHREQRQTKDCCQLEIIFECNKMLTTLHGACLPYPTHFWCPFSFLSCKYNRCCLVIYSCIFEDLYDLQGISAAMQLKFYAQLCSYTLLSALTFWAYLKTNTRATDSPSVKVQYGCRTIVKHRYLHYFYGELARLVKICREVLDIAQSRDVYLGCHCSVTNTHILACSLACLIPTIWPSSHKTAQSQQQINHHTLVSVMKLQLFS